MKTTQKQNRSRDKSELDPRLVAAYADYPAFDSDNAVRGLATFLVHNKLFRALGATAIAAAAERAWWADALFLAAEPADTAASARIKCAALQPALDGTPWQIADDGLRAMAAMIAVAVALEQRRFGLDTLTHH